MKPFLIFCAISCFVGIFRLPIEYYTFLRILIFIGASIIIYNFLSFRQYYFSIIFLIILILFNPFIPIYLYRKSLWIPIDTITGILFLLVAFVEKLEQKPEEKMIEETSNHSIRSKAYSRDKIINPRKLNQE
ncbi:MULTISPECIES: DUF6804 family protein [Chryseobacterium]|uniref:DUF6804 family protein n=1 Tax=Chryseobacterium TaxID=59732 RepID=UPI00293BE42A|nr:MULTISPECIES: DUF6804 family protein [Chryseobacterium]